MAANWVWFGCAKKVRSITRNLTIRCHYTCKNRVNMYPTAWQKIPSIQNEIPTKYSCLWSVIARSPKMAGGRVIRRMLTTEVISDIIWHWPMDSPRIQQARRETQIGWTEVKALKSPVNKAIFKHFNRITLV